MAETVRIEIPIEVTDNTDPELSNIANQFEQVDNAAKQAQNSVNKASRTVSQFDKSAEKTRKSLSSWMKQKYQLLLEAKDKVSPIVDKLKSGLKTIGNKAWNITMKAVDMVTSPVRGIINLLKNPVFQVGAVLGVSIGLKDTIDTFVNFEAAMSQVKAISGATGEDFDKLTEKAKYMGATTKFTATEAAEGFNYMAMAGWKTQDMLEGIEGIMSLAAASGESLGTTSDIVTDALTAFGLKASDSGHFADVLAQASANANTNVGMLGESFKYIAPVAGAMGYKIEDISLALGLMANSSVKGSMAGTALKTALANMAAPTDNMAAAMEKYGISLTDGNGKMKSFKGVMDNLRTGLGGLAEAEQTAAASTIFGKEAMAGMLSIINASEEDYNKLTDAVNNADGASKKMADTMLDNLKGAFTLLQSAADGVKLSLGERLKPYLMDLATWLTEQMPNIEAGLMHFMDYVDEKVDSFKNKIAEFTSTDEWKNADFMGKVKIAWDEIIAQPFGDWWDSKGHSFFVGKAGSIGRGIGTAISTGLLALLGVDVSGAVDEGASVGSAFAKGLIDGFDVGALKEKIWSAIGGIFSNAGKILPGGEEADLTSWLSAAAIAKVGLPLLSVGAKGAKLGKSIFGSQTVAGTGGKTTVVPGIGRQLIGSFSTADELAGVGMAKGTGLLGLLGNIGMSLGSGASTSAGLVASGAGAVAGGVIGGVSLYRGGKDLYKGFTSKNEEEAAAYKQAGAARIGGVAMGAGVGALIGGPVGALIGAGIGGIVGNIAAKQRKKEYEEALKAAEELKLAEEQAKYETQDLKDALADSSMTAEEFGQKFQKAVGENLKRHFGDIKLSMQEIQDIAKKMTFGDNIEGVTKFSKASSSAEQAYSNMGAAISNMDKLNWKASLGMEFDDSDIQEYIAGIDALIQSATDYVESKHYEAKTAIDLLVEPNTDVDMTTGLNAVYASLQEQINSLGTELTAKVNVALEDGVITLDEQAEITDLQNQISEITQKVSDIQTEAEFKALKIKYSGANLDADSFAELQSELQEQVESATQSYDEALKVGIASLELQLSEGAIDQSQYDEQIQALAEGYEAKISDMQVRVENFQLDSIAEAYSTELDGILPEIEGTTAEKLKTALHNAMASGVDATTWDTATASQWLGIDSLSMEAQTAITEMMSGVAETVPQSMQEQITSTFSSVDMNGAYSGIDFVGPFSNEYYEQMAAVDLSGAYAPLVDSIGTALPSQLALIDYSGIGTQVGSGVGSAIQNTDMEPINSAIGSLKGNTGTAIDSAFAAGFSTTTPVTITADYRLANPTATISFSGGGSGTATVSASLHANGGYSDGPELTWWGEDGPEVIIPLGTKRRNRGIELWKEAGNILGVEKHADGGMIGNPRYSANPLQNSEGLNYINETLSRAPRDNNEFSDRDIEDVTQNEPVPVLSGKEKEGNSIEVKVSVQVNPTFQANGSSGKEEDIVRVIKANMKELADEIGGELAERLEMIFSNMPAKEA
jgi:TP901 family phage tail tape measure protein